MAPHTPKEIPMKFSLRALAALALSLSGLVGAVSASATNGSTVKIIQGKAYGFNAVTDVVSNGAHVFAVNSAGNSVTELEASTGNVVNVLRRSPSDSRVPRTSVTIGPTSGSPTTPVTR